MHVTKNSLLILSLGCVMASACAKSNPDTTTPEPAATTPMPADPTPASDPATEPVTGTPGADPAADPMATDPNKAPPAEPAPPKLTDAEIAAVVKAANDSEIEQGKLAKTMAKDKAVKDFAAMMVKHHTDMNKSSEKSLKKNKLEPQDSELSARLKSDAAAATEKLKATAKGAEFDKAYIDAQVAAHTQVLDTIDKQLLPNVQNPDLKAELDAARPKVEEHLTKAKDIQATLTKPAA